MPLVTMPQSYQSVRAYRSPDYYLLRNHAESNWRDLPRTHCDVGELDYQTIDRPSETHHVADQCFCICLTQTIAYQYQRHKT